MENVKRVRETIARELAPISKSRLEVNTIYRVLDNSQVLAEHSVELPGANIANVRRALLGIRGTLQKRYGSTVGVSAEKADRGALASVYQLVKVPTGLKEDAREVLAAKSQFKDLNEAFGSKLKKFEQRLRRRQ